MQSQRLTALQAALVSMNVPHRQIMDEATFDGLLSGTISVTDWESHLEILFSDVPICLLQEIIQEKNIELARLSAIFSELPNVYQNHAFKDFLDEKLGTAV